jgi:hypothetical protein
MAATASFQVRCCFFAIEAKTEDAREIDKIKQLQCDRFFTSRFAHFLYMEQ